MLATKIRISGEKNKKNTKFAYFEEVKENGTINNLVVPLK